MTTQQDLLNALNTTPAKSIGIPAATSSNILSALQACVQAVNMLQGTTTIASSSDRAVRWGEFTSWQGTVASGNSQLLTSIDGVITQYNTLTQTVKDVTTTISTIESIQADQAQLIQQISATASDAQASVNDERTARIDGDQALADRVTKLSASFTSTTGDLAAQISSEASARASADSAITDQVDTLSASVTSSNKYLLGQIQNEATTRANADSAQADVIHSVQATANNNSITLTQHTSAIANINGKMSGEWVWSTTVHQDTNARVINGAKYGIDIDGSQVTTTLRFAASTFAISNGDASDDTATAPFLVVGNAVKIISAIIQDASITNGKIQDAAITNAKIAGTISSNQLVNGLPAWSLNKDGYFTAQNATITGDLTAGSITGQFQAVATYHWDGNEDASTSGGASIVQFVCPAPVRSGQVHRPQVTAMAVTNRGGGGDSVESGVLYIDRLNSLNGNWDQVFSVTLSNSKYNQIANYVTFLDNYHSADTTYRFRWGDGSTHMYLESIAGQVLGLRV